MKLTTQKKEIVISLLKDGLSTALAFVLLVHAVAPLQVKAEAVEAGLEAATDAAAAEADAELPAPEEPVEPPPEQTVQEILLKVCRERGYDEVCAKHLLGMLWKESNNIATAIGDGGRARGYFQIHYKLHKISIACAEDLECSANWSISYLERNSYPRYVSYAVQCHNGCNINNGYAASALRHGTRLWNQPLKVQTAAERRGLARN